MLPDFPLIIADESVDARIIRNLVSVGYEVYSIADETPGISDDKVIEIAIERNGFIITEDKDFGDVLVYSNSSLHMIGSLLLRIFDLPIEPKNKLILEALSRNRDTLKGSFSVLTSKKLRIRKYNL